MGIVIGGSGQGEAIAANKVHGSRTALCHDEYTARFARRHNDANVLSLGARVVATELALDIVDVFMATAFDGGRHQARIDELSVIEAKSRAPAQATEADARLDGPGTQQGIGKSPTDVTTWPGSPPSCRSSTACRPAPRASGTFRGRWSGARSSRRFRCPGP